MTKSASPVLPKTPRVDPRVLRKIWDEWVSERPERLECLYPENR